MHRLSALALNQRFVDGSLKAVDIAKYFIDRIERLDPAIGAFLALCKNRCMKKAEELDARRKNGQKLGRLAAVPVGIKDNIHIKGELTTCASKFLENYRAVFDATVTKRLEDEDALLIGKTNLDEFAMGSSTEFSALQKTANPWHLDCVPGGSSGGSAAAVAARFCPLSLGSDTGGSIRQPASFCGVMGLKPSYGWVSRYGLVAFASSMDQIGPFANYAEDLDLLLSVISGHCEKDSTSLHEKPYASLAKSEPLDLKNTTIGLPHTLVKELPADSKAMFEYSVEKLKTLGCRFVDVDLSFLKHSIAVYCILATAEASTNLARFDGIRYGLRSKNAKTLHEVYELSKEEGFGPEVKRRILLGTYVLSAGYREAYFKKAQKVRQLIIEQYQKAFKSCDLIASPVSAGTAYPFGAMQDPLKRYLADLYTIPANLSGLPAVSLPLAKDCEQKPFGLQVLAQKLQDGKLCQLAKALQDEKLILGDLPKLAED